MKNWIKIALFLAVANVIMKHVLKNSTVKHMGEMREELTTTKNVTKAHILKHYRDK